MWGEYMQQQNVSGATHNLILENKKHLTITGAVNVSAYDENGALIKTNMGLLNIGGKNISVSELSTQSGEVKISGEIEFIEYSTPKEKQGFLKRLVK